MRSRVRGHSGRAKAVAAIIPRGKSRRRQMMEDAARASWAADLTHLAEKAEQTHAMTKDLRDKVSGEMRDD